jgi:pyrroloquinoline quinone biosynthesis protein B
MAGIRLVVLGSAAGGGYPQWNCRCPVCALYWQGDARVSARTQSSVAVTANGRDWVLLNCSPDIRSQILQVPALHPAEGPRHSPIAAVFLTNGDIDHTAGLLSLRERQAFSIHGTPSVLSALDDNPLFAALDRDLVQKHGVQLDVPVPLAGMTIEAFAVPGKVPLYLEDGDIRADDTSGWAIGLKVSGGSASCFYIPGCADVPPALGERLREAPLVLFDGTLWRDDEMVRLGLGTKTARRMGHMAISGADGTIERLRDLAIKRKIFIHINNSNPILIDGSAERLEVEANGWEVAYDGMDIAL